MGPAFSSGIPFPPGALAWGASRLAGPSPLKWLLLKPRGLFVLKPLFTVGRCRLSLRPQPAGPVRAARLPCQRRGQGPARDLSSSAHTADRFRLLPVVSEPVLASPFTVPCLCSFPSLPCPPRRLSFRICQPSLPALKLRVPACSRAATLQLVSVSPASEGLRFLRAARSLGPVVGCLEPAQP